ncbi:hypothetical protein DFH09DRAFT_1301667 [Mycena vulgaris]|nr:hypothetical protein DFH09DRAFT_1301667 [Mycena vulgaris]
MHIIPAPGLVRSFVAASAHRALVRCRLSAPCARSCYDSRAPVASRRHARGHASVYCALVSVTTPAHSYLPQRCALARRCFTPHARRSSAASMSNFRRMLPPRSCSVLPPVPSRWYSYAASESILECRLSFLRARARELPPPLFRTFSSRTLLSRSCADPRTLPWPVLVCHLLDRARTALSYRFAAELLAPTLPPVSLRPVRPSSSSLVFRGPSHASSAVVSHAGLAPSCPRILEVALVFAYDLSHSDCRLSHRLRPCSNAASVLPSPSRRAQILPGPYSYEVVPNQSMLHPAVALVAGLALAFARPSLPPFNLNLTALRFSCTILIFLERLPESCSRTPLTPARAGSRLAYTSPFAPPHSLRGRTNTRAGSLPVHRPELHSSTHTGTRPIMWPCSRLNASTGDRNPRQSWPNPSMVAPLAVAFFSAHHFSRTRSRVAAAGIFPRSGCQPLILGHLALQPLYEVLASSAFAWSTLFSPFRLCFILPAPAASRSPSVLSIEICVAPPTHSLQKFRCICALLQLACTPRP